MVDRTEYEIDHAIAEGMESLLADVIRKYPILYDKDAKHRNGSTFQEKSEKAWSKISDELNLELDSCKSLWSCMKQKFIKHRKRLDNGETVSSWPTYNKLHQWLDRHVKKRKSRNDYIKQVKMPRRTSTISKTDDDTNEPDEEWTELLEDKDTTVQIQLKRKSDNTSDTINPSSSRNDCKKKFNIEVISDCGTTVYDDTDIFTDTEPKALVKDTEIVVLEKEQQTQIEMIEIKEPIQTEKQIKENEFFNKIERFFVNYSHLLERCNVENLDSNDAFGKYIASMIRELPAEKRMKIRLNILQYATELISNETHHTKS